MKIIFHGGAGEVGKSCIEIQTEGKRYLLDAGIKFVQGGTEYPKNLDKINELDGIFLSHAHLDHSGALPMLEHKNLNCPIYMTKLTWKITNVLLEDSHHLESLKHLHPSYVDRDIKAVENDIRFVKYDQEYTTNDGKIKFRFLNAGHIPGSASILLEVEGKKVLYTGDINTENTLLMVPSQIENLMEKIDILITENTYGDRPHPERKDCEDGILKSINSCMKEGGSALIPVFSVGRSQEILMVLKKLPETIPVYMDGMARKITELVLSSGDPYVDNKHLLEEMSHKAVFIKNPKERFELAKREGIVILSTSGMVQGGPVVTYAEKMIPNKNNFVILTGYQSQGTNGRFMFEDHLFYSHHQRFKVEAHVRKFDFSAHYGQDSIRKLMVKMKPKHLILQHGDLMALTESRRYAEENLPETKTYVPMVGDEIEI